MKSYTWKENLIMDAGSWLLGRLMWIWFSSVRVTILNRDIWDTYFVKIPRKENAVVATWHRHVIFTYFYFCKLRNLLIMGSKSKDAEFAIRMGRRFGLKFIRGSSSRGGEDALNGMIAYLSHGPGGKLCSTPVDGPRGPARKVKTGMLTLAKETGACFIPMACSGNRVITIHRAWDRTIIPLPFSRVVFDFHPPLKIPPDISDMEFEKLSQKIEDILNTLTDRVDRICGYEG